MEASALQHAGAAGLHGRSPLLRLQSDERLVALIRRGNHHAFEALVARYQSRLLAFCRHMLSSREDAEDVLQEVFAAAFNAMLADDREINVRPWLYRIARNRSLNHLRRAQAVGMDSMDIHLSEGGLTTADKVHKREEFRLLIADVQDLPETQRTALLLREIDALSYDQIAEAMETTVPSVKSLLVRARVSLAEAAEARLLSCDEVRLELGEVAEGLTRTSAPVRRHLRTCDRCTAFRKQLRSTNKALAALYPVGPLILLKKLLLTHIGTGAAAGSAAAAGGAAASSAGAGAALQVGFSAFAVEGRGRPGGGRDRHRGRGRGPARRQAAARARRRRRAAAPGRQGRRPRADPGRHAAAGPGRLRPAADRAERAQGQADQGDRAQDRRGQGRRQGKPTPTPTGTPSATPTTTSTPTAEAKGGDTTALPTDTLGTAQPGSGSYTPPQPTPTSVRPGALRRPAGRPDPAAGRDPVLHPGAVRDARGPAARPDPDAAAGRDPRAVAVAERDAADAGVDAAGRRRPAARRALVDRARRAGRRRRARAGSRGPPRRARPASAPLSAPGRSGAAGSSRPRRSAGPRGPRGCSS